MSLFPMLKELGSQEGEVLHYLNETLHIRKPLQDLLLLLLCVVDYDILDQLLILMLTQLLPCLLSKLWLLEFFSSFIMSRADSSNKCLIDPKLLSYLSQVLPFTSRLPYL